MGIIIKPPPIIVRIEREHHVHWHGQVNGRGGYEEQPTLTSRGRAGQCLGEQGAVLGTPSHTRLNKEGASQVNAPITFWCHLKSNRLGVSVHL